MSEMKHSCFRLVLDYSVLQLVKFSSSVSALVLVSTSSGGNLYWAMSRIEPTTVRLEWLRSFERFWKSLYSYSWRIQIDASGRVRSFLMALLHLILRLVSRRLYGVLVSVGNQCRAVN